MLSCVQKQEHIALSSVTSPPIHLSPSAVSSLLLASIRETFPAATTMEIDDLAIPGQSYLLALDSLKTGATTGRADREILKRIEDRLLSPPDHAPVSSSIEPFAPLLTRLQSRKQSTFESLLKRFFLPFA